MIGGGDGKIWVQEINFSLYYILAFLYTVDNSRIYRTHVELNKLEKKNSMRPTLERARRDKNLKHMGGLGPNWVYREPLN